MCEVARIDSIIIFHLSKLWKAKFFILCDAVFWWGSREHLKWSLLGVKRLRAPPSYRHFSHPVGPTLHVVCILFLYFCSHKWDVKMLNDSYKYPAIPQLLNKVIIIWTHRTIRGGDRLPAPHFQVGALEFFGDQGVELQGRAQPGAHLQKGTRFTIPSSMRTTIGSLTLSLQSSKSTFSQPLKEKMYKWGSEKW